MQQRHVPVSHRSARHFELSVSGFLVTHARFEPGSTIHPHVHERDIVAVMLSGSFDVAFAGRRLHCADLSVHTEPGGERHSNRIGPAGAEVVVIQPDPSNQDALRPFRPFLDSVVQLEHGGVRRLGRRLLAELATRDDCALLAAEAIILDMLVTLARTDHRRELRGGGPPSWLRRAREMVEAADDRLLTTTEIATAVGVHPASLVRAFRTYYRLPLGTYARAVRLEAAAHRLLSTPVPTAQIAVEAGFVDQSHFTRRFREHYGTTPDHYRRRRLRPTG